MTRNAASWTADHLPWIVVVLIAFWLPPVLYGGAVATGILTGTGYPRLTDLALLAPVVELSLMMVAVPPLRRRKIGGWSLLVWSRVVVLVQTMWTVLIETRLVGFGLTVTSRPIVEAMVGLLIAAYVLAAIRPLYR